MKDASLLQQTSLLCYTPLHCMCLGLQTCVCQTGQTKHHYIIPACACLHNMLFSKNRFLRYVLWPQVLGSISLAEVPVRSMTSSPAAICHSHLHSDLHRLYLAAHRLHSAANRVRAASVVSRQPWKQTGPQCLKDFGGHFKCFVLSLSAAFRFSASTRHCSCCLGLA